MFQPQATKFPFSYAASMPYNSPMDAPPVADDMIAQEALAKGYQPDLEELAKGYQPDLEVGQ